MAGIISQEHADRINQGDTSRYSPSTSSGNNTSGSSSNNALSSAFGSDQGHQVRRKDQWGTPNNAMKIQTSIGQDAFNNQYLGTGQRKAMGASAALERQKFNPLMAKENAQKKGLSFDAGSALRSTVPAQAQGLAAVDDVMAGSYEEGLLKDKLHQLKVSGMQNEEAVNLVMEMMRQGQLGKDVANAFNQMQANLMAADITGQAGLTNRMVGGIGGIFDSMFGSMGNLMGGNLMGGGLMNMDPFKSVFG